MKTRKTKMDKIVRSLVIVVLSISWLFGTLSCAQEITEPEETPAPATTESYTLITPLGDNHAYLIDMDGNLAHKWELSGKSARVVYLLENHNLLATHHVPSDYFTLPDFAGGGIEILDWEGNQLWSYELSNEQYSTHHDVELMPNGNILAKSLDKSSL